MGSLLLDYAGGDYSQFGEQGLIAKHVRLDEPGMYLDLGCHSPVKCSNTYKLYQLGWRGVGVDANSSFAWLWRLFRPKDVFIARAVANPGMSSITFYEFDQRRSLVSSTDLATALEWQRKFGGTFQPRAVATISIEEAVARATKAQEALGLKFRLLSVDLEGVDVNLVCSWLASNPQVTPEFLLIESHVLAPEIPGFEEVGSTGPSFLFRRQG